MYIDANNGDGKHYFTYNTNNTVLHTMTMIVDDSK